MNDKNIFDIIESIESKTSEIADTQLINSKIAVRKSRKQEFVRIREGAEYCFRIQCVRDVQELYFVVPALVAELEHDVRIYELYLAISRQGEVFLYPHRVGHDDWARSEAEFLHHAKSAYCRKFADQQSGL